MRRAAAWLDRLMKRERHAPRVPDSQCVYAVGDIHGRLDLLEQLLAQIWDDAPTCENTLVFLGDYVDRGPASKGVVDYLLQLQRPGWEIVKLRGNHEHFLLEYLKEPQAYQAWRQFGGADTLLSYGVRPPSFSDPRELVRVHQEFTNALPRSHLAFFVELPFAHTVGDYFFVHAGARPGVALDRQSPDDMLWIRDDFLLSKFQWGKVVVHGHTPVEAPTVRSNRINIDTGAYVTNSLTALRLTGEQLTFLTTGTAGKQS